MKDAGAFNTCNLSHATAAGDSAEESALHEPGVRQRPRMGLPCPSARPSHLLALAHRGEDEVHLRGVPAGGGEE